MPNVSVGVVSTDVRADVLRSAFGFYASVSFGEDFTVTLPGFGPDAVSYLQNLALALGAASVELSEALKAKGNGRN